MLDKIDHAHTTVGYEEEVLAGKALQHEIMRDLLDNITGFGMVVALILLAVQSLT